MSSSSRLPKKAYLNSIRENDFSSEQHASPSSDRHTSPASDRLKSPASDYQRSPIDRRHTSPYMRNTSPPPYARSHASPHGSSASSRTHCSPYSGSEFTSPSLDHRSHDSGVERIMRPVHNHEIRQSSNREAAIERSARSSRPHNDRLVTPDNPRSVEMSPGSIGSGMWDESFKKSPSFSPSFSSQKRGTNLGDSLEGTSGSPLRKEESSSLLNSVNGGQLDLKASFEKILAGNDGSMYSGLRSANIESIRKLTDMLTKAPHKFPTPPANKGGDIMDAIQYTVGYRHGFTDGLLLACLHLNVKMDDIGLNVSDMPLYGFGFASRYNKSRSESGESPQSNRPASPCATHSSTEDTNQPNLANENAHNMDIDSRNLSHDRPNDRSSDRRPSLVEANAHNMDIDTRHKSHDRPNHRTLDHQSINFDECDHEPTSVCSNVSDPLDTAPRTPSLHRIPHHTTTTSSLPDSTKEPQNISSVPSTSISPPGTAMDCTDTPVSQHSTLRGTPSISSHSNTSVSTPSHFSTPSHHNPQHQFTLPDTNYNKPLNAHDAYNPYKNSLSLAPQTPPSMTQPHQTPPSRVHHPPHTHYNNMWENPHRIPNGGSTHSAQSVFPASHGTEMYRGNSTEVYTQANSTPFNNSSQSPRGSMNNNPTHTQISRSMSWSMGNVQGEESDLSAVTPHITSLSLDNFRRVNSEGDGQSNFISTTNPKVEDGTLPNPEKEPNMRPKDFCQICGDVAVGFHCGAFICEACKKFFLRSHKGDGYTKFRCSGSATCEMNKDSRGRCAYCRFKKCMDLGMYLPGDKEKAKKLKVNFNDIPCKVCGAPSSGYHFSAITCEGCKGFFRRVAREVRDNTEHAQHMKCLKDGACEMNRESRSACKYCRYKKCVDIGMTLSGIRMGRQPYAIKRATLMAMQGRDHVTGEPLNNSTSNTNNLNTAPMSPPIKQIKSERADTPPEPEDDVFAFSEDSMMDMKHPEPMNLKTAISTPSTPVNAPLILDLPSGVTNANTGTLKPSGLASDVPQKYPWSPPESANSMDSHPAPVTKSEPPGQMPQMNPAMIPKELLKPPSEQLESFNPVMNISAKRDAMSPEQEDLLLCVLSAFESFESQYEMDELPVPDASWLNSLDYKIVWNLVENAVMFHAKFVSKFFKKIPGLNTLDMNDQTVLLRECIYPVTHLIYSKHYDLETKSYNWFNMGPEQKGIILKHFPQFKCIIGHYHACGSVFQKLKPSPEEKAIFTTILCLSPDVHVQLENKISVIELQMAMKKLLADLCRARSHDNSRYEAFLFGMSVLQWAGLEHLVCSLQISQDYPDLDMGYIWKEIFGYHLSDNNASVKNG